MADAIKEELASRISSLLGLPLDKVQMLVPMVDAGECQRLLDLDDDSFMTESTKAIAAAQQQQLQGNAPARKAPAAPAASPAASPSASPRKRPQLSMVGAKSAAKEAPPEKPAAPAAPKKSAGDLQLKPKGKGDSSLQLKPKEESPGSPSLQLKPKGESGDKPKTLQLKPKGGASGTALQLKPKQPLAEQADVDAPTMRIRKRDSGTPEEPPPPTPLSSPSPPEPPSVAAPAASEPDEDPFQTMTLEPPKPGAKRRLSLAPKAPSTNQEPPPPPGLEDMTEPPRPPSLDDATTPPQLPGNDSDNATGEAEDQADNGDDDDSENSKGIASLDPRRARARRKAAKKKKMVLAGAIAAGVLFFVVITIFFYNLFAGGTGKDMDAAIAAAQRQNENRNTQPTDPADPTDPDDDPDPTEDPNGFGDPIAAPEIVELPIKIITLIENAKGPDARDELLAQWAEKDRDERIAQLVQWGMWEGEVPPEAQAIIDGQRNAANKPPPPPEPKEVDPIPEPSVDPTVRKAQFQKALAAGSLRILTVLVDRNKELLVNTTTDGQTALHLAVRAEAAAAVATFVKAGADLQARDQDGNTPLHVACTTPTGDPAIAKFLIANGASVAARDNFQATPLHKAAAYGQYAITQLLLKHDANATVADARGVTPLHLVANPEVADLLLTAGADANARDAAGNAPIHSATIAGRTEVVAHLIGNGSDVNLLDRTLSTPLHLAVSNSRAATLRELLRRGASPLVKNEIGETALALAVRLRSKPDISDPLQQVVSGKRIKAEEIGTLTRRMLASGTLVIKDKNIRIKSAVALYFPRLSQLSIIAFPIVLTPKEEARILAGKVTEPAQMLHEKPVPDGLPAIPYAVIELKIPANKTSYSARDCEVERIRYYGFTSADSVLDLGDRVGAFTKIQKFSAASLATDSSLQLNLVSSSRAFQQKFSLNAKVPIARVE